jgi:netrin-G3 ligand
MCLRSLAVPGQPRRLRVEPHNSTAITVEWRPPSESERNGIIRGYQIHYYKVNEEGEPYGHATLYDVKEDNTLQVVIGGLESNTYYQVQVAAYTRKGDGERSRPKRVRTKGDGEFSWTLCFFS